MKKSFIALSIVATLFVGASVANAVEAGKPYVPFEDNYPTYVLSDDSKANPQPFEANYPVFIKPMTFTAVKKAAYEPFEADYPTYVLSCSNVEPAPFEDCYPVPIKGLGVK